MTLGTDLPPVSTGDEVDSVASRFYAASSLFNGATEVVTVVLANGPEPSMQDVRQWQERHAALRLIPRPNHAGILALFPPEVSEISERHSGWRPGTDHDVQTSEKSSLLELINMGLDEPLGMHLWRLSFFRLPGRDSAMGTRGATWALVWRRNHLISDAYTTDLLLADLIENASGAEGKSRTWMPTGTISRADTPSVIEPTSRTLTERIEWNESARATLTKLRKTHGISSSAAVGAALASSPLFPRTGNLHVAHSLRTPYETNPGCHIGVLTVPLSNVPADQSEIIKIAETLDARIRDLARTARRSPSERWDRSVRSTRDSLQAALGPCVTNSGTYSHLSAIANIQTVATAVDRKQGNYTTVAHIDHFRGTFNTTLTASSAVFTEQQLKGLAFSLQNKFSNQQIEGT